MLGSFIALNTVLHVTPLMSDVCYHTRSEWHDCWLWWFNEYLLSYSGNILIMN